MSLPTRPRKRNFFVTAMYIWLFGSGMYCGILISEGYHQSLERSNPVLQAESMRRNRNLMAIDIDKEMKRSRIDAEDQSKPAQFHQSGFLPIHDFDTKIELQQEASQEEYVEGPSFLNLSQSFLDKLPYSAPTSRRTKLPNMYQTTKSIAGCLFIMDDTIRLLEWLAYHYTVLPLSHLMVAIDPNSQNTDRIIEILNSWKGKIEIKAYRNDTEWLNLPWDYGYSRNVRSPNGKLMKWYREKKSEVYFGQVHKRRQNYFCVHCMRYMKEKGMDWTIITDSDEYLMFNYPHEKQENHGLYDSLKRGTSKADIDKERGVNKYYRERLPAMETRATIADYLHQEKLRLKCIMFPGLQFTSYESPAEDVYKDAPNGVNPYHLVTLRHRIAGQREGEFSKTMVDVSHGTIDDYSMETNVNVHVPNKLLCGMNGNSGSRKDYISSVFRLHHYRTGTWESFIERSTDRRANMTIDRFMERNTKPMLIDDDIRPWLGWFIEKVGMDEARRLLVDPLAEVYSQYRNKRSSYRAHSSN